MITIFSVKRFAFMALFILGTMPVFGQSYKKAEWSREKMDSVYDYSGGKAAGVIGKYRPAVDSLLVPIGKTREELKIANNNFEYAKDPILLKTSYPILPEI